MSWLGKIFGGAFGFLMGGPLGAILGASLGHQFDIGMDHSLTDESLGPGDAHRVQMAFFTATFSVMGHIAKADGRVSEAEINMAKQIMGQLALSEAMRTTAINLFQQGKNNDFPLDDVLDQFRRECHRRTNLIRMFLEIQLQSALADGQLHAIEDQLLLHICHRLGISRFEYERIKLQVNAQQRFYSYQQQSQHPVKKQDNISDAYAILGLTSGASDSDIKKAYRRLISQHHPDKLVAKGLPEEMMTLAKEKTQRIRKAYETITEARKSGR
jgi:DnaJ like chaperone protein